MLLPLDGSMPGGVSEAISVNPSGVSRLACMILSPSGPASPYSPNVFTTSSPPSADW